MPERTALVSIEWARTRAVVRDVACPADDGVILAAGAVSGSDSALDATMGSWARRRLLA